MKKNKTLAYALAAILLVGGTFQGTKAWFTAQQTANTDLIINTGTVSVEATDDGWYATQDGTETGYTQINAESIMNAKPGDVFNKVITITNTGTLNQTVDISGGQSIKGDNADIIVNNVTERTIELAPGQSEYFPIIVELNEKFKGQDVKLDLKEYMTPILLDAEQTAATPGDTNPDKE